MIRKLRTLALSVFLASAAFAGQAASAAPADATCFSGCCKCNFQGTQCVNAGTAQPGSTFCTDDWGQCVILGGWNCLG